MCKVRVRRISPSERRILHRMKRQLCNAVNRCHAKIILASSGRIGNRQIAEGVGYSASWVRTIIHRFNAGGREAIEWYPWMQARDRPRKFLAELREEIAAIALSPPKQLIGLTQWSLSKLREYLVQQQIVTCISLEWLRQILLRCGVRWRRTKTWKESNDPQFWEKFRRIRRLYGARPPHGRRICVDEFGPLNLQPRSGHCLAGPGKRLDRLRATYHRGGGVRHLLAAYDLETDRLFGIFSARKTWREFLKFLKWLRHRYPSGEMLHIVLDNYGPHLKDETLAWAREHRVHFYFTPTNASWLNRIECQLTELKKFTLDNSDYKTHDEQEHAIESYLSWRNRRRLLPIASWRKYKQRRRAA